MYLTGFADEASQDIKKQIEVTKALGWENIEARSINNKNIHDISDEEFDTVYGLLQDAGVKINCFGSAIANWGKSILEPADSSYEEAKRAIPRMKKLGTKLIRVMSFAQLKDRPGTKEAQMFDERVKRLKVLKQMFDDNGIIMVHENCNNYGGMSYHRTLQLVEAIPGLRLVFDTGNPIIHTDWERGEGYHMDSYEFYSNVKPYIEYIHIKDAYWNKEGHEVYTYPNLGDGQVEKILTDLIGSGYDGGISIEPHVQYVFHDAKAQSLDEEAKYQAYYHYGVNISQLVDKIKTKLGK